MTAKFIWVDKHPKIRISSIDDEELKYTYLSTDKNIPTPKDNMRGFTWVQRVYVFYPNTCELEDMGIIHFDLTNNVPEFLRRWIGVHGWDASAIRWAIEYNVTEEDITLAIGKEAVRKDELYKTLVDKGIGVTSGKYINLF